MCSSDLVAEMGDWGYFPTPKAQQIGTFTLEFEVVPYAAGKTGEAFTEGYAFQQDLTAAQAGLSKAIMIGLWHEGKRSV